GVAAFVGRAEVPLADDGGGVAGRAEDFRDCHFRQGKIDAVGRRLQGVAGERLARVGMAGDELEVKARRGTPSEYGRARRGANGRGGIRVGEAHAFGGEAIEVRRVGDGAAVEADIHVAKVVGRS